MKDRRWRLGVGLLPLLMVRARLSFGFKVSLRRRVCMA
jgi:hypothetical protein